MSEAKHTRGPWSLKNGYIVGRALVGAIAVADMIKTNNDHATYEANARLIAAAPDLLAALKTMVELFDGYQGLQMTAAKAAIAKAEGKP